MTNGRIDENGLPVYAPGDYDFVRVVDRSTGASRNALAPEVTSAARALSLELGSIVQDARDDIDQIIRGLGYLPPVPYASGLNVNDIKFTVSYSGDVYAPKPELVPFTTAAWNAAQWNVIQGDINLRSDLADPTGGAGLVAFKQRGDSEPRGMGGKAAESVSLLDFIPPSEHDAIRDGTSLYDAYPAILKAIAAVRQQGPFVYPVAGIIDLPIGTLHCSQTLFLDTFVHFRGHGSGMSGGNWGTKLKFPANTPGIIINKGYTGPNENGADGSIIEGVYIEGGGGTLDTAHGINLQARAKIRDCTVDGFSGHGINIDADIVQRNNANLWQLETVLIQRNRRDGLFVKGGDSNAGLATMLDVNRNGGWGINDRSFLGNTYIGCHADGNGSRSMVHYEGNRYYVTDDAGGLLAGSTAPGTDPSVWTLIGPGVPHPSYYPEWVSGGVYIRGGAYQSLGYSNRNTFIGCYSESGSQPPSHFSGPTCIVIGGLHAAAWTGAPTFISDGKISLLTTDATPAGGTLSVGLRASGDPHSVLSLRDSSSAGQYPYRLKYQLPGVWALNWGNAADWMQLYNRDSTPANGFGRDMSAWHGGIGFPRGFYMGDKALIKITPGAAAPTSGDHRRGDRIINQAPTVGQPKGWICTVSGTPGTWVSEGNL